VIGVCVEIFFRNELPPGRSLKPFFGPLFIGRTRLKPVSILGMGGIELEPMTFRV
jgi:hypothetical protein